jgi:uncharacterized protein
MSRALLIFARPPAPGRVKTRLTPFFSPQDAAELYDCMVRDVVTRTAALNLDARFLMYEDHGEALEYFRKLDDGLLLLPQQGEGLGERLANAFAELFSRGYTTLAVIGTDSPDLPLSFIVAAYERLESGTADAVFGPTEDGGYYLAALTSAHPELFREIPWSSDRVLELSLQRATEAGLRPSLLPLWYDLDEPSDLSRAGLLTGQHDACRTRNFLLKLFAGDTQDTAG